MFLTRFFKPYSNLILFGFQPHVNSYLNFISQLITIYKFYNIQLFCWHFFKISLWSPLSSFFYFHKILSVYLKSSICVFAYPFTNTWSSHSHELHNVLWKSDFLLLNFVCMLWQSEVIFQARKKRKETQMFTGSSWTIQRIRLKRLIFKF